jgi:hypothetical protein
LLCDFGGLGKLSWVNSTDKQVTARGPYVKLNIDIRFMNGIVVDIVMKNFWHPVDN